MARRPRLKVTDFISRRLLPKDLEEMKLMHDQWFPIRYPEQFFILATSLHSRLQSEVLIDPRTDTIAALVVWRQGSVVQCDPEDSDILPPGEERTNADVIYVLTIGVSVEYRRCGLASRLIRHLLSHAATDPSGRCRCVYLHVLTSNDSAIRFYESHGFNQHKLLKDYYEIADAKRDAFTYTFLVMPRPAPDMKDFCIRSYRDVCWNTSCSVM
eukprot:m.292447 g.292447  ORF g.292447 m.292447 type:complete len:213 (-) comp16238_c0_seq3:2633-3271(-)